MNHLDIEEQEILESFENGEWRSIPNVKQEILRYQRYAQANNLEVVNIEIQSNDFQALQLLAKKTDLSVSEFIASVLHQYVSYQSQS